MAKKKTRRKTRQFIKREFNVDTGTCTMTFPNGDVVVMMMNGLPSHVFTRLAMIGACHLVAKRKDPEKAWQAIRRGEFGRGGKKSYPLIVQAIATAYEITVERAERIWNSLDKSQRTKIRSNRALQSIIHELKAERLAEGAELPSLHQQE